MKNKITLAIPVTFTTTESPNGGTHVVATGETPAGLTPADLPDHPVGSGPTRTAALADLRAIIMRKVTAPNTGRHVQCDAFGGVWVGPYYRPHTARWYVTVAIPDGNQSTHTADTTDYWDAERWIEHGRAAGAVGAFIRAVGVMIERAEAASPSNGAGAPSVTYDELAVRA